MSVRIVAPSGRKAADVKVRDALMTAVASKNWESAASSLMKYGYYLELLDPSKVEEGVVHTFTASARVVH